MEIAIYDVASAKIIRRFSGPEYQAAVQCNEGEEFYLNCPNDATHIVDQMPVARPPELTPQETIGKIVAAVQSHLDETARTRNYDNMLSLASYANSMDPQFAAEAAAGIAWRDACWRYCYQALAEVEAGQRTMPTAGEAIAELPQMVWP